MNIEEKNSLGDFNSYTEVASIEEELWRIFTFYSLQSNPIQLEFWSTKTFLRFARETQIIAATNSNIHGKACCGISVPIVELEIKSLLTKSKISFRLLEIDVNEAIDFGVFLQLLSRLAPKLYDRDNVAVANRRLLLENVLPLSNRRIPLQRRFLMRVESMREIQLISKELLEIFNFYLDRANIRRNSIVARHSSRVRKHLVISSQVSISVSAEEEKFLNNLINESQLEKNNIGYVEFLEFCDNFHIRSSSLISTSQIAEIFFEVTPRPEKGSSLCGMNFDSFLTSIMYLAVLCFYDLDISHDNKIQSFLLLMWKAVNNNEFNKEISSLIRDTNSSFTSNGSHDLFGSNAFSKRFLMKWRDDGYKEYSVVEQSSPSFHFEKNSPSRLSENGNMSSPQHRTEPSNNNIVIHSNHLRSLFSIRPDLAEYVYLNIRDVS